MTEPERPDGPESLDDLFGPVKEAAALGRKPFKFLDPYGPEDADLFFGRDPEIREVYARYYGSRLLLVYGESGAGKTSLLQCGLRGRVPPEEALFVPFRSGEDPLESLRREVLRRVAFPDGAPEDDLELLREAAFRKRKTLALVFDQMEECFLFAPKAARERFAKALAAWMAAGVNVRVVLSIREEYLARLGEWEPLLPELYRNRLWVRRVDFGDVKELVEGPCRAVGVPVEPDLTAAVTRLFEREARGVDLPTFQVLMDRLYDEASTRGETPVALKAADLERVGGLEDVLAAFLERAASELPDPAAGRELLKAMVSAEGTKLRAGAEALAAGAGLDPAAAVPLLASLETARVVRRLPEGEEWELRHDRLAKVVFGWLSETEKDLLEARRMVEGRLKDYQSRGLLLDTAALKAIVPFEKPLSRHPATAELIRKSREHLAALSRRRKRLVAEVTGIAFLVLALFTVWNVRERRAAERERDRAEQMAAEVRASEAKTTQAFALSLFHRMEIALEKGRRNEVISLLVGAIRLSRANGLYLDRLVNQLTVVGIALPVSPPLRHSDEVWYVAFSPDGSRVATGSADKTGLVWDARTGVALTPPLQHGGPVSGVAFSPDGARVATSSWDGTARVWDARTGAALTAPLRHEKAVDRCITFSPDGTRLATGSMDNTARVWCSQTGKAITPSLKHGGLVFALAFNRDGTRLATASFDKTSRVWNALTGEPVTAPLKHDDEVVDVAFSPDGTRVATASLDKTVRIWDARTGAAVTAPLMHENKVWKVVFSPNGKQVFSFTDTSTYIWNAQTGESIEIPFRDHQWSCVAFSPDLTRVLSQNPNCARVKDIRTGATVTEFMQHNATLLLGIFSPDGQCAATYSRDQTARIWDARGRGALPIPLNLENRGTCAAFSPDGTRLAAPSGDRGVRLWDTKSGGEILPSLRPEGKIGYIGFDPRGLRVATVSDVAAQLWDARTGQPLCAPLRLSTTIRAFAFSPDWGCLAMASTDRTVQIWETRTGSALKAPLRCDGDILDLAFHADGTRLVVLCGDRTTWLWNFRKRTFEKVTLRCGEKCDIYLSPEGTKIASRSENQSVVRVWDARTGLALTPPLKHEAPVKFITFSLDGTLLATGSLWIVHLWDLRTGAATAKLIHEGMVEGDAFVPVINASFSQDGTRLITETKDRAVRIWDVKAGAMATEPLQHDEPVHFAIFSPDGKRVATMSGDHTLLVWDLGLGLRNPPDWFLSLAEGLAGLRLDDSGNLIPVIDSWDRLQKARAIAATGDPTDPWIHWARWFLADCDTRTVSPSSDATAAQYRALHPR
ncbi:MAG: hypothetical protein KA419_08965 [Acidobacteria bacterium]|nr:hypothetical protein [Acidobacteriota bacterium]